MTSAFVTPDERHGFTVHEEWDEVGLIHMNGRLYDPTTGRFLSADPTIQYADDMQNYNRYSYINNNPLSAVDYSGYGFFKSVFKGIRNAVRGVGRLVSSALKNPTIRTIASIAAGYYTGGLAWESYIMSSTTPNLGFAALVKGAVGGFTTAIISSGGNIKAAMNGAMSGAMFAGAGQIGEEFGEYGAAHFGAHALAGCSTAAMSGGSCGNGAVNGLTGKLATWEGQGLIGTIVASGTVSVIGGGKFANGAMTGAFGYLYNACTTDPHGCAKIFSGVGAVIGAMTGASISTGCDVATSGACVPLNPGIMVEATVAGSAMFGTTGNFIDQVHANSMNFSGRPTVVYQLVSNMTEEVMKYGITSNVVAEYRYTQEYYRKYNVRMEIMASYPMRWMARTHEVGLCGAYIATHGELPRLSARCHMQEIRELEMP